LITVAGTVIADFFARTLADEPPRGFLTVIDEIGFHLGGAAPNTGAVLARLNVPVSLVGRIGNDPLGILVRQQIEKWADKVSLACDPDCQTTAVIGHIFRRVSGMASRSRLVGSCSNRQCSRRVARHKARGGGRIRKLGTSDGSTQTANREPHLNTEVKRSSLVVVLGSRESRRLRFKRTAQNKLDFAHPVAENFAYAADECWAFDVPEVQGRP
jgi:hypothetical protein